LHAQAAAASCLSLWIGDGEGSGNGRVRVPGLHDVGDERRSVVGGIRCHTRFWKVNRMRTMYVLGSETHVHSDYIIGHHHTMLEINSGEVLYYIKMSETSTESNT
jgi:hypothetical protein